MKKLLSSLFIILSFLLYTQKIIGQELYLSIKGSSKEETSEIDSIAYQPKHDNFNSLLKETDSLFYFIQKQGYVNATRNKLKKENDSTFTTRFSLGKKIKTIKIFYDDQKITKSILEKISSDIHSNYFVIPFKGIEKKLQFLNKEIADQGKPFYSFQLSELRIEKNELSAFLKSNTSQNRTIDSIAIKGYEKFPRSFIKNFLRIKKGKVFNKSEIDKKIKRLSNLRFVNSIRDPEVLFTKDTTTLYFYLEKRNSNIFDGFLGFATNEETNNLEVNGFLNLQLINNLNFGESLNIEYKSDGNKQQRFRVQAILPYLFNTPFGTELELELFRKDSTFTTSDQSAKLTYQLNSQIILKAGYKGSTSNYLLEDAPVTGTVNEDFNANYFLVGGTFQDLNDYQQIIPIKSYLNIETNFGKRERESNSTNQVRIQSRGFYNFFLNNRNIIYFGNETGYLNSDDYLTNELFRFGGIQNLRGFQENGLFASFYSAFQTEYRYLLSPTLYMHSIIDFATLQNKVIESNSNNLYGIGFGLALKTQAGLLKLNFANGKTEEQNFEFRNTKIHLSLSAFF
ncbi:POTRA domain-containing protein [Mesonia maritima]|uniref:Outer membrane protein assembly factor BamA n=1 Tax=Mesonia maritima TaxID=1793873 RepID=A0ABU1K6W5_9FLAO|nr:POTRA domain-containing protein [Mesonia maritima]MDR6301353.1 outer membrane protein assembly factor BamA [Mesonia maritima]